MMPTRTMIWPCLYREAKPRRCLTLSKDGGECCTVQILQWNSKYYKWHDFSLANCSIHYIPYTRSCWGWSIFTQSSVSLSVLFFGSTSHGMLPTAKILNVYHNFLSAASSFWFIILYNFVSLSGLVIYACSSV